MDKLYRMKTKLFWIAGRSRTHDYIKSYQDGMAEITVPVANLKVFRVLGRLLLLVILILTLLFSLTYQMDEVIATTILVLVILFLHALLGDEILDDLFNDNVKRKLNYSIGFTSIQGVVLQFVVIPLITYRLKYFGFSGRIAFMIINAMVGITVLGLVYYVVQYVKGNWWMMIPFVIELGVLFSLIAWKAILYSINSLKAVHGIICYPLLLSLLYSFVRYLHMGGRRGEKYK